MQNPPDGKIVISCPECKARFKVPADRISPTGSKVSCVKCKSPFVVLPDGRTEIPVPQPAAQPAPEPVTHSPAPPPKEPDEPVELPAPAVLTTNVVESEEPVHEPPMPATVAPAVVAVAATAAPVAAEWRLDVPDYAEYTFTLVELRDLLKDGGLYPNDRVTKVGEPENWVEAIQVPEIRRLFEMKDRIEKQKSATGATKKAAGPVSDQFPCANHPEWEADFRCTKCGKQLCTHCVEQRRAAGKEYMICKTCKDMALKLDKAGSLPPFYTALPTLMAAPFKGWGSLMLIMNGILYYLSQSPIFFLVPQIKWLLYAIVLAYLLWIVKYAARGRETVPDWPDTAEWMELAKIGIRASTVTFICIVPLLAVLLAAYLLGSSAGDSGSGIPTMSETPIDMGQIPQGGYEPPPSGEGGIEPPDTSWIEQAAVAQGGGNVEDMSPDAREKMEKRLKERREAEEAAAEEQAAAALSFLQYGLALIVLIVLCLIFAFIYYPMGLAVAAVWDVVRPVASPFFIFGLIRRVLGQYVILLIFFAVFLAAGILIGAAFRAFIPIPILPGFLGAMVTMYTYFVTSFLLGRFAYTNDRALEWEEAIYPGASGK